MKKYFPLFVFLLLTGCSGQNGGPDPVTGNPSSETPAQYRERISKSNMPEEDKRQKLDEIDRMAKMNEEMLLKGKPQDPTERPSK